MTKEQKKQEFINDLKNCNSKEDEQKMMEKWEIGRSVFFKAKKKLGIKRKAGVKSKLDFLD